MSASERRDHWNDRYATVGADSVSWFEPVPHLSLAMLELAGVDTTMSVIDIGGGASSLSRSLVDRGSRDVTVLDLSENALGIARSAFTDPTLVEWITADITEWEPARTWDVWHDRAVFHFLTEAAQRDAYRARLDRALASGGAVCVATFAEDGPAQCSGLDVAHYSPSALRRELGDDLREIAGGRYLHTTPSGGVQPFSWIVATR